MDRSWYWYGEIEGRPESNPNVCPTPTVWRIWTYGRFISEAEYRFMLADAAWVRQYAPQEATANPDRPATAEDLRKRKAILPPGMK